MNVIEITNLSKTYRKGFWGKIVPAVVDVSFSVKKGIITGFVGPNGAGKTTTIKTIMGLVRPTTGVVKINGIDSSKSLARNKVAYLSEQPYFYGHLSVYESLKFAAHLIKIPNDQIDKEIRKTLDIVELADRSKMRVKEMSKGMQQRLNMAQALLGTPETMILDEPMSGMDPPGRRLFRTIFRDLSVKGVTIFFSTHVLEDIESICGEVVVLSKGKLTYAGKVDELLLQGASGTEITIPADDPETVLFLSNHGCQVQAKNNGELTFCTVPGASVEELLRGLASKDIFPKKVMSHTRKLEELLYGKDKKDSGL